MYGLTDTLIKKRICSLSKLQPLSFFCYIHPATQKNQITMAIIADVFLKNQLKFTILQKNGYPYL